jgi:hypothetical protein
MESKIIVHEKSFIPWFKEFPFEETEEWGQALRDSIPKTQEAILKDVPDTKSFLKNRGQPLINAVQKMLNDGFVSKKGLAKEAILAIMKSKLYGKNSAKTYRKNLKKALKNFDQGELNNAMVGYHRGQCFGEYRFRDAIELALNGLTTPLIIQPGKEATFISELNNQLISSGILISDSMYDPEYIKLENDKLNSLINKYLKKGLVPFSTGGLSRCDFVLIKDSVTPANSTKPKEIKYEIYKHFLGDTQANKLRATWTVMDESTPPNPQDYLGNHIDLSKQAYFDMELDVQVSEKD